MQQQSENLSIAEVAALFGMPEKAVRERIASRGAPQTFFSIQELADRWRCSRGTVRNRLRASGARILDFGAAGKRSKKAIPAAVVLQIESKHSKILS